MDELIKQRLVDTKILIGMKNAFNGRELKEIYEVYNLITGENKPVSTCGACLTTVISKIKKTCRENQL